MAVRDLTPEQQLVARRCVETVFSTEAIEEWEYSARLGGVRRSWLESVLADWPPQKDEIDESEEAAVVRSCLLAVANCNDDPRQEKDLLRDVTREQANAVYSAWIRSNGAQD